MENEILKGIVFIVLSFIPVLIFIVLIKGEIKVRRNATVKTKAVVTNYRMGQNCRAIFKFDVNGNEVVVRSQVGITSSPFFKEGQVVDLYYNPQNPYEISVPKERKLTYLFMCVSVFMFVLSMVAGIASLFGVT